MTQFHSTLQIGIALGAGHFGQVFAGTDQLHGDVAIKILEQYRGESASDWQTRKADLLSEGKRLEAASHPNVVRVYSVVESTTSNAILLVMERCTGGCLDHRFKIGPMLLSETRNIATDIALGLQALHQRGMLHRDIKPGNILLDGRGKAKLGDFGLVTDNLVLGYASQQGYADHVAYEVWQGHGTSEKSDIWAFGMTIYRLLHGEDWYSRSLAPRHLVQNGGFADQLPWLPHIPKPWRRFIRKTLEDDTALRYQNMSQVKNALADLPFDPPWNCQVMPNSIKWYMQTSSRSLDVVWTQHSQRKHSWEAMSNPLGTGKRRCLGKSGGRGGSAKTIRQLEQFFARQT